jgi:hypothetical protein
MKKRLRIVKKYRDSEEYFIIEEKFVLSWKNISEYITSETPLEFSSISEADIFIDNHNQLKNKSVVVKEITIRT